MTCTEKKGIAMFQKRQAAEIYNLVRTAFTLFRLFLGRRIVKTSLEAIVSLQLHVKLVTCSLFE